MKNKSKLSKVVNVSSKIVRRSLCNLSELYVRRVSAKSLKIIGNTSQIFAPYYEMLQSGKRYRFPLF